MEITLEIAKEMIATGNMFLIETALEAYPDLVLENISEQTRAFQILQDKIKTVNGNWIPNFEDDNEYKHCPVFEVVNGVFSFYRVRSWISDLNIPAPLLFKSEEECKQFVLANIDLYRQLYSPLEIQE